MGSVAAYGEACGNCARTKCRCILRGRGLSCERLNKQCLTAPHTRGRAKRKTRAAQLEEKLGEVVTLLKAQDARSATANQYLSALGHPIPLPSAASPFPSPSDLSAEEETTCLGLFRGTFLPSFPFVHIPEGTTVGEVKRRWPFLWMVATGLTCRGAVRRGEVMRAVEEGIAMGVVVSGERGVDFLVGVVAVLGWLGYQGKGKPYMWLFAHLAMTIAGDLGLDRPIPPVRGVRGISLAGWDQGGPSMPSSEDIRAVLGCYIICSVIGGFFHRSNPMPWSPTLQRGLEALRGKAETPGDQLLVAQAQMYRLLDELAVSPWRNADVAMGPGVSPVYYMRSMSGRLEDIMLGVTDPEVAQCLPLHLVHQTVKLAIHELILHHTPPPHDIDHVLHLHAALASARTWFDTFFSRPLASCVATPLYLYGGFLLACRVLHRLTLLECPGWDRAAVRGVVDLLDMLERTADAMEEVPRAAGFSDDGGEDVFSRAARLLRGQRAACVVALGDVGVAGGEMGVHGMGFQEMGFSGAVWMEDMFGGAQGM